MQSHKRDCEIRIESIRRSCVIIIIILINLEADEGALLLKHILKTDSNSTIKWHCKYQNLRYCQVSTLCKEWPSMHPAVNKILRLGKHFKIFGFSNTADCKLGQIRKK